MLILVGLALILVLTVATGYFVAQEFAYVAVDRSRLRTLAEDGDAAARAGAEGHRRGCRSCCPARSSASPSPRCWPGTSPSPTSARAWRTCSASAGVPQAVSVSVSVVLALLLATVIQMVLGELAPKNLAIAKAEAIALRLARSTLMYLTVAGPLIRVFDSASNRILRRVGIEPVEELPAGRDRAGPRPDHRQVLRAGAAGPGHHRGCSTAASTSAAGPPARRWCRGSTWSPCTGTSR